MNNYELMVIFTPVLSEEDFKASQKKYSDMITEAGGEIIHSNPWGLKSLAYPIQKKTTGIYWVLEFNGPSDLNEKLKIQMLRDGEVLTCAAMPEPEMTQDELQMTDPSVEVYRARAAS